VLPGSAEQDALAVARAVVRRVAGACVGDLGRVTVSAGLAGFPDEASSRDRLLAAADAQLYRAKSLGGNRVSGGSEPLAAAGNSS
jgi:GGDEF domain-containing protein